MRFLPAHRARRQPGTILIADFSGTAARVYGAICHAAGYDVVVCLAKELRDPLPPEWLPDVVLIVARGGGAVHRPTGTPQVPVVLICDFPADENRGTQFGYAAVLVRPVSSAELRTTIAGVLYALRPSPRRGRAAIEPEDAEQRELMLQISREEYREIRATSKQLREDSQLLCRYARELRSRSGRIGQPPAAAK